MKYNVEVMSCSGIGTALYDINNIISKNNNRISKNTALTILLANYTVSQHNHHTNNTESQHNLHINNTVSQHNHHTSDTTTNNCRATTIIPLIQSVSTTTTRTTTTTIQQPT